METLQKQTLYVCGCCKHTLPSEAFYVDKRTGLPSNYCKECRKSASRKYRKTEKRTLARDDREPYPVITSTKDPDLRQKLILSALQTVRASIKRKKQKLCEVEAELNDKLFIKTIQLWEESNRDWTTFP